MRVVSIESLEPIDINKPKKRVISTYLVRSCRSCKEDKEKGRRRSRSRAYLDIDDYIQLNLVIVSQPQ